MSFGYDWIFWSAGAALGLMALWLLYWSLFKDSSRGRRRCPKCWYDMGGSSGLTCSECGHIARQERKLLKTRRRWRWAALGVIVASLGVTSAATPTTARHGWERIVPTTILILMMPDLPTYNRRAGDELVRRLHNNDLTLWQWRWLLTRAKWARTPPWVLKVETRDAWPQSEPLYCEATFNMSPGVLG